MPLQGEALARMRTAGAINFACFAAGGVVKSRTPCAVYLYSVVRSLHGLTAFGLVSVSASRYVREWMCPVRASHRLRSSGRRSITGAAQTRTADRRSDYTRSVADGDGRGAVDV